MGKFLDLTGMELLCKCNCEPFWRIPIQRIEQA
jgi:hypothetical protein